MVNNKLTMVKIMTQTAKLKHRVILEGNDPVKYNEILCKFLEEGEGRRKEAYDDYYGKAIRELQILNKKPIGNITVGIGYNMKNGDADWNYAFRNEPEDKKPSFGKVKNGEVMLTDEQIDKLLVGCIERRRGDLLKAKLYKSQWQYLEPNEKLAIEDLYFNVGCF